MLNCILVCNINLQSYYRNNPMSLSYMEVFINMVLLHWQSMLIGLIHCEIMISLHYVRSLASCGTHCHNLFLLNLLYC